MPHAILYDSTRCEQCGGCIDSCKLKWGLPDGPTTELSATTYAALEVRGGHPIRRSCMHCLDPACVSVCPVGAMEKTETGPVVYHADRCMGCRYCMTACPFDVPRYEWDSVVPRVRKCLMCFDRLEAGKAPACTLFCPVGGIVFGEREDLLRMARTRLHDEPDRYHPHIYGENEVGGTSVLVIAAVPPGELGLPANLPLESLPKRTWQVLSRLPGVILAGAAFCLGMRWVIGRRDQIAEERAPRLRPPREAAARSAERELTEVGR